MSVTIGLLYPGHSAEDDYPRLEARLAPDVSLPVQHTAMLEDVHRLDALLDWGRADRLAEGARGLASRQPDAVLWACTSGSFAYGWAGAQDQAARLTASAGVPASSTSLAFVTALQSLGLTRVAVSATYPEEVAALFVEFLSGAGVEVVSMRSHDIVTAAEVGTLDRAQLVDLVAQGADDQAEAVLLPDTALHTVDHLDALEDTAGKCVLTANQVTAWEGLRLVGHDRTYDGLGSLFRSSADDSGLHRGGAAR
ncbi:MAG: maleate cis-trans isomerase [Propionibacteriales bacterium]|nr:maleate cis-trans isomerase [Propionibacteriales bacterium]